MKTNLKYRAMTGRMELKAAEDCTHSKTLREPDHLSNLRQVLECVQSSAAFKIPLVTKSQHSNASTLQHSNVPSSGVALVITLILLAVITFMAVTFLVVTQSERGSVSTQHEQEKAKLAAEGAIEHAKVALLAPMLQTNKYLPVGLIVSTNFINDNGLVPGLLDPLNVNYDFKAQGGGSNFTIADIQINESNLRFLSRPPVFVTNTLNPLNPSNEFRFYVDLNRNRQFDPTGPVAVMNNGTNVGVTNYFVGDPQWVGITERPGLPHSMSNRYVGRYAFVVVPSSTALDINNMHNYSKYLSPAVMANGDGFLRNMGAGSYELNFGAFLTDLNTNYWPVTNSNWGAPYRYYPNSGLPNNEGAGFEDAVALLRYRYQTNWLNGLWSISNLFGPVGKLAFAIDNVDGCAAGPVMTGFHWPPPNTLDFDRNNRLVAGWAGAENANRFFDMQELYDQNKTRAGVANGRYSLTDRLTFASTNLLNTYDRYTFYRLLAQLGTDSDPDSGKMNLNYDNLDTNGVVVPDKATNFVAWTPVQFFTNAAIRLLKDAFSESLTNAISTNLLVYTNGGQYCVTNILENLISKKDQINIQIYPTNFYTPSVHRLLQLAANIYDASTNRMLALADNPNNSLGYPSVFRPLFYDGFRPAAGQPRSNVVYIVGFEEVTNADIVIFGKQPLFRDLTDPRMRPVLTNDMIYGVPLVVGAKKGLPNFNELAVQTDVRVTRKLHFHRDTTTSPVSLTNQIFTVAISNVVAAETWNSYAAALMRNAGKPLQIFARADVIMSMTNELGLITTPFGVVSNAFSFPDMVGASGTYYITNLTQWNGSSFASSFKIPLNTNFVFLTTNAAFNFLQNRFVGDAYPDPGNFFPVPHWWLKRRVRLQLALVDNDPPTTSSGGSGRLLDYVNLVSEEEPLNIMSELIRDADCANQGGPRSGVSVGYFFCTNRLGNPSSGPMNPDTPGVLTYGLQHQINVASGQDNHMGWWKAFGDPTDTRPISIQQRAFMDRLGSSSDTTTDFEAPFNPFRIAHFYLSWQANDPLVHYTPTDLVDFMGKRAGTNRVEFNDAAYKGPQPYATQKSPLKNLLRLNEHYRPWKGNPSLASDDQADPATDTAMELKDPMLMSTVDYDFPTNKFPNIGWLGRVHRGTPWQSVYMKSPIIDPLNWERWSGHVAITNWDGFGTVLFDDIRSRPTNDFRIFDFFTTAFNDNSSKGKLSVNQTNLAAWSAALGGIVIATDTQTNYVVAGPAGIYDPLATTSNQPPLVQIVAAINSVRTNFSANAFEHLGDILFAPELTTNSPYISKANLDVLNDEVYERIPQQILGLLKVGQPRFVVYAFGQALKPAEHSIVTGGPFPGLCTNYQVTAETTLRAVVRIDGSLDTNSPAYPPRAVVESYNVLGPY